MNTKTNLDPIALRADFPTLAREVHGRPLAYLDNAASSQKPCAVIEAMDAFYRGHYANIHRGVHTLSEEATAAYEDAGVGPEDIDVIELHDCFATNELATYSALGLCPDEDLNAFVAAGDNTYGGRYVVNPSGGLLAKGHPLGATGLAQITELTLHLRGAAGQRQVEGARTALQHNGGLGSAGFVHIFQRT